MSSNSSEDESGQVKHAASMLMKAVQNFVNMPAATSSGASSSSNKRRRRKRLKIDQEENCNTNELGPSGVNAHCSYSVTGSRLPTQAPYRRGNDGVVTGLQTVQDSQPLSVRAQGQRRDLLHQSLADPNALRSGVEPRVQRNRPGPQLTDQDNGYHRETDTQGTSRNFQIPTRTYRNPHGTAVSVQQQRPLDFVTQKPAYQSSVAAVDEHKRLFGFQPSKQYTKSFKGKGSATRPLGMSKRHSLWKKKSFCLADCQQSLKPTPQEKISLAKMGLETKCLVFNLDGNVHHVHSVIMKEWPVLGNCGGYTLLRLAENSHSLVEIEPPLSGHISVQFLKAILNNAILYIRPLQRNIEYADMEEFAELESSDDEPSDYCQRCNQNFTLTNLRRHIATCQGDRNRYSSTYKDSSMAEEDLFCLSDSKPDSPELPSSPQRSIHDEVHESPVMISSSDSDGCGWESDVAVQRCLEESLRKDTIHEGTKLRIEEVISEHRSKLDNEKTWRITVRRHNVLEDMLRAMKTSTDHDLNAKHMEVIFLGESAIDEGGPKREFFRLLMKSIQASGLILDGAPGHQVLRHNVIAFKDNLFKKIGNIIALSILHGGPGPTFFGQAVVDYLIQGISSVKAHVTDIPDVEIQSKINMLKESKNEQEFITLLFSKEYEELRKNCGILETNSSYSERTKVVDAIILYCSIGTCLAELEQLRHGLSCLNFDDLIKNYPALIKAVFKPPATPLSANYIQDEFRPCFSPVGSTRHHKEEAIVMCWIQYLQHVEAQGEQGLPSLKDIMTFLTGCDSIPPLGFSAIPGIDFTDDEQFPTVSTCSLTLTFSRKMTTTFQNFKEVMDHAILGSEGFGRI